MSRASEEIEFKAGVDAATLTELRRLPVLRKHSAGRADTRQLLSVYYDADDLRLAAAGLFLRMRRVAGRWEQTVKAARRAPLGLQRVTEVTDPAPGPAPDPARISSPRIRAALDEVLAGATLSEVCRSRMRRTQRLLRTADGVVELALDRGVISAGDDRSELCELEIECVQGEPALAFSWARRLLGGRPARLLQPSKAARGFALARGEPLPAPAPQQARPGDLAPVRTADEAFAALFELYARAIAENLYCVMTQPDPEGAHQLRVSLRRLRSLLQAGEGTLRRRHSRDLRKRARDIGRLISALRDADALIEDIVGPALCGDAGEPAMLGALEAWREQVRLTTRVALREAHATAFAVSLLELADLATWRPRDRGRRRRLRGRLLDLLQPALDRAWNTACAHGASLSRLSAEQRHELRKDLKHLRYTAELALLDHRAPDAGRFFLRLEALQDDLGLLNDLVVLDRVTPQLRSQAAASVFDRLLERLRKQRDMDPAAVLRRATRRWRVLRRDGPFWQPQDVQRG